MKLNEERLAFIRENRQMEPKKLAKALGVGVRHVERALRNLGDQEALRRAKVRRVCGTGVLALLLGTGGYFALRWKRQRDDAQTAIETKRREAEAKKVEQEIYRALDKGEAGREDEMVGRLTDESESVRLAAVRYLLAQPTGKHVARVMDRVDDGSDRVRLATLQLLAKAADPAASQRLLKAASEKNRAAQERVIALNSLASRPAAEVRPHAKPLLDCLGDLPAVQRATHDLLARVVPEAKVVFASDANQLRSAWQSALEVRQ